MGDIVSLVEKAAETIDQEKAQRIAEKMRKGKFDLEDLRDQLAQMEKIGGIGGMLGMLPGIGKMKAQLENANLDDRVIKRQRAIIDSMTAEGAPQPGRPQGLAQEAHRGGLGHQGRGGQQAPQDAPPDGRHDEDDGRRQARRHRRRRSATCSASAAAWAACRSRRRSRSRRCRSRWAASCRPSPAARGGLPPLPPGLGGKGPGPAGPRRRQDPRPSGARRLPVRRQEEVSFRRRRALARRRRMPTIDRKDKATRRKRCP